MYIYIYQPKLSELFHLRLVDEHRVVGNNASGQMVGHSVDGLNDLHGRVAAADGLLNKSTG